jgi:hypothetical protein
MLPLPRASPHDDAGRLCVTTQTLFWCADPNPVRAWRRAKEEKKRRRKVRNIQFNRLKNNGKTVGQSAVASESKQLGTPLHAAHCYVQGS